MHWKFAVASEDLFKNLFYILAYKFQNSEQWFQTNRIFHSKRLNFINDVKCQVTYNLNRKVVMYSQERIVNDGEFCSLVTIQREVFCPTVHAWNLRLVFQGFSNCVLPIFPGLSLYRQTNNTSWTNRHREQGIFSKRRKAQMGIRCCDCFWTARKTRKGQWNR